MNRIITLGTFDVIIGGQSIMDCLGNQKRLIRLFKYFLIHNNTRLLAERILDDLYGNEDLKDPLNMLRGQIFRLRRAINENKLNIQPFFKIEYINGYYIFELEKNIKVDFLEFEEVLGNDILTINQYIKKDSLSFKELLLEYKGDLLSELNDHWVIPTRIRFERLYTKGLLSYIDYLKKRGMYTEIIEISEKAIKIKPYDEAIYLNLMEALVELEQEEYALMHYNFFAKTLRDHFGISPSEKLIQFYNKNKWKSDDSNLNINFNTIKEDTQKAFDSKNVTFCDYNNFKFMYNNECLNKERTERCAALSIITLESKNYEELSEDEMSRGMELLAFLFYKYLKPVDIVSKWNEKQMIMLLYDTEQDEIENLARNIHERFNHKKMHSNLRLNIEIRNI